MSLYLRALQNFTHVLCMFQRADSPIPCMHINTGFTAIVYLSEVYPILSVPYLHLLVARDRQWIDEVAKNQLSWIMVISRKIVKVLSFIITIITENKSFQVFGRGQNGLLIGICDDRHQSFSIFWVDAAPVGWNSRTAAAHRPWPVNKLHCLHMSTFCHFEGTILVIFGSKADRLFAIYLLPTPCWKIIRYTYYLRNRETLTVLCSVVKHAGSG